VISEADRVIAEAMARRHWFRMGEPMPRGKWMVLASFRGRHCFDTFRPCATRSEARAYARMQRAYGDVRTTVRAATKEGRK
jgi:hypothetical protein